MDWDEAINTLKVKKTSEKDTELLKKAKAEKNYNDFAAWLNTSKGKKAVEILSLSGAVIELGIFNIDKYFQRWAYFGGDGAFTHSFQLSDSKHKYSPRRIKHAEDASQSISRSSLALATACSVYYGCHETDMIKFFEHRIDEVVAALVKG